MSEFYARLAATTAMLERIGREFQPVSFASSLAAEDMVLADLVLRAQLPVRIFTLDTGRLHPETLAVVEKVREHYGYDIEVFRPRQESVDSFVAANGENAFYDSVEMRRECCRIRKVEPLGRALAGSQAWITGQRREQSTTRAQLALEEFDSAHGIMKFNPLADWSTDEVWHYLRSRAVPYNALHDRGYPSIGCEPCTRAIAPGEDIRAGRWWWESPAARECGLHVVEGKLVRIQSIATEESHG